MIEEIGKISDESARTLKLLANGDGRQSEESHRLWVLVGFLIAAAENERTTGGHSNVGGGGGGAPKRDSARQGVSS